MGDRATPVEPCHVAQFLSRLSPQATLFSRRKRNRVWMGSVTSVMPILTARRFDICYRFIIKDVLLVCSTHTGKKKRPYTLRRSASHYSSQEWLWLRTATVARHRSDAVDSEVTDPCQRFPLLFLFCLLELSVVWVFHDGRGTVRFQMNSKRRLASQFQSPNFDEAFSRRGRGPNRPTNLENFGGRTGGGAVDNAVVGGKTESSGKMSRDIVQR